MKKNMRFLVTGGAGFIGSALIRYLIDETDHHVLNLDKLTYAGNLDSLSEASCSDRYQFLQADICDKESLDAVFWVYRPDVIMHLAAESHVDRSIDGPGEFVKTNIEGTFQLLEAARTYWAKIDPDKKNCFRFHHVSTDEVYGDLGDEEGLL